MCYHKQMRTYFNIAYRDKERAKKLGALWCAVQKSWYADNVEAITRLSEHFSSSSESSVKKSKKTFDEAELSLPATIKSLPELKGEDRGFGGNMLFVDLVPRSCWFSNVRSCVSPSDWRRLSLLTRSRAGFKCEICATPQDSSKKFYLEAHERWLFTEVNGMPTQVLKRLVSLCKPCHTVTHFGLAQVQGKAESALRHLKKVNNWSEEQAWDHIEEAFDLWQKRNNNDWFLDISLLEGSGIDIIKSR